MTLSRSIKTGLLKSVRLRMSPREPGEVAKLRAQIGFLETEGRSLPSEGLSQHLVPTSAAHQHVCLTGRRGNKSVQRIP